MIQNEQDSPAAALTLPPAMAAVCATTRKPAISLRQAAGIGAWAVVAGAAILLLIAPALWNGYPLLQWDTGGYLARWFEGYLVPSRPGAYGLFLAAGIPLNFWPNILIQSALTIWTLLCLIRALDLRTGPFAVLCGAMLLSLTTTLPLLTSILLTDIFAGLSVLALYLLVFKADALARVTRWSLMALIAFSAATHSATFGLLAILACLAWALRAFDRSQCPRAGVRRAMFAVLMGAALTLTANYSVSGRMTWTPGGYGILFGRMLQDGLVKRYLDDTCPNPGLRLCPHRNKLPRTADEFLWSDSVFNDLGRFAGLGSEMRIIVLGSLARYPGLQAKAAVAAMLTQIVRVSSGEGVLNSIWHTYGIMRTYTPQVLPAMRAARQQHGELQFETINRLHVPVALISMALLPVIVWAARRRPALRGIRSLAATATVALLANACICGILSNPHDRYGARLAWIAPLIVLLALMQWLTLRRRAHVAATSR